MRIAHFTDLHVTAAPAEIPWSSLFSKRWVGWVNLRLCGRFGVFEDAERVTEACVRDVLEQSVDHVVITGDYTGISLPAEFAAATRAVEPLRQAGVPTTTLPGNHDVYARTAVRDRLFERFFSEWTQSDLVGSTGHPKDATAPAEYPLVRLLDDDVALLALRDARPRGWHDSSGAVGKRQLGRLAELLAHPQVRERTKVLALHYGLRRADGSPDTRLHGLRDAAQLLDVAAAGGVALVIHGHLHGRFVHPTGSVSPVAIANPGSLTARGHARAYHIYTVSGSTVQLEARRYDLDRNAFIAWPDAPGAGDLGG